MSWASSMARLERPPFDLDSPFSLSVWLSMAVEDRAKIRPMANETDQICPKLMAKAITTMVVRLICSPPMMNILLRIAHSSRGFISNPIRNNIITTPNSAKC